MGQCGAAPRVDTCHADDYNGGRRFMFCGDYPMVELVVTAEQAKFLAEANGSVEIVDAKGKRLGFFARRFSEEEVAVANSRAAAGTPGRSTAEVLERLQSLSNQ